MQTTKIRKLRLFVVCLSVLCIGVGLKISLQVRAKRRHHNAVLANKTRNGMVHFAGTVQQMVYFEKELPEEIAGITEMLRDYNDGDSFEWLMEHVDPGLDSGQYHDAWGTPILLDIKSQDEYRLISAGGNRKYDGGQRDDIVYSFDPRRIVKRACEQLPNDQQEN